MSRSSLIATLVVLAAPGAASAQTPAAVPSAVEPLRPAVLPEPAAALTERADPADVATIDGILRAFYETISGPAGQPRQWARDSTLYLPGHRFIAAGVRHGVAVLDVMDHGTFAALHDEYATPSGFFEQEVHREERRFGHIAHVLSTYEWRQRADGPVEGRGVNSVQLVWDGRRWWIASAIWDSERPGSPVPPELLPPGEYP